MKSVYVCSNCGSENIQAKAWVGMNNPKTVDWSASESGDSEDFWCPDCEGHHSAELVNKTIEE